MSKLSKKKSHIWKHFSVINKDKAKCEYCFKIISYSGGGTSNLNRHMKKLHRTVSIEQPLLRSQTQLLPLQSNSTEAGPSTIPLISEDIMVAPAVTQRPVQLNVQHFAKTTSPLPVKKKKQLDEQIVKFIVKGFHPFSIVEETEFKNMYQMILPTYVLPSRKIISTRLIPKLYQATKEKVLQLTAEADAICLTTEGWTSSSNDNYIALTAHFINQDTTLKSVLLGCTHFDEWHTSENLSAYLLKEVAEWGISNKIAGIITDNSANIVVAVHLTTWQHFPCFAHTVNHVVQHSLDAIKVQLDKIKAIVQYFKDSSSAASKLQAMQIQMDLPPLKLKQSVVTRWNSTYDMLDRIIKIKDAVVSTLAIDQPRLNTLTPDEWSLLEKCVQVLKVFYDISVEMSADKSVSISKVLALNKIIKTHVDKQLLETESGHFQDNYKLLLQTLRKQLDARFEDIESHVLASEASFLDPRFKKYAFIDKDKYDQCLRSIRAKLCNLFKQEPTMQATTSLLEPPQSPQQMPQQSMSSNIWDYFDKEVEKEIIQNPTAAGSIEIEKYLNEPLIPRTDDPLKWWYDHRLLYPNLYSLMKRRLCVPATSVPCERVFSEAGMTISQKRSSLKSDEASQILFLNYNL
ncbi:unnamed protein product [Euphydryas editha]|uniref:BED-type domain-containing protein n=1 Tax=Euphydryas editha TaxID=104508 RepID=A0AAU9USI8_EUPED|nr:unnamed protein product [Euphydryas editha]